MNYRQGIYHPKHPEKYIGRLDETHPRYLSSYEFQVFEWMDRQPAVRRWGSECVVIPYQNPSKLDSTGKPKMCRYMIDLYVEYVNKSGATIKELVEIKPTSDLVKPVKRGRMRKDTFLRRQLTWLQNQAKWAAAEQYAKRNGMRFRIITEKDIFI